MRVSELMSRVTVTVAPEDSVACAARLMDRHSVGALPVCSRDGRLRGIITDRDIVVRCVAGDREPEHTPVKAVMSRHTLAVPPEADLREAALYMAQGQVRRLPVTENGRLRGMLSLADLARLRSYDMETARALAEISLERRPEEG